MIRLYARSLIIIGLCGLLAVVGKLAIANWPTQPAAHGAAPMFVAYPHSTRYHAATCEYVDHSKPLWKFASHAEAKNGGMLPCDHCLSGQSPRLSQSPSPAPTGTARPPSRGSGR